MQTAATQRILRLAEKSAVIRPRDLDEQGISRKHLGPLCRAGLLRRIGRGLYVLSEAQPTENRTLAEVAKRIPGGVVCLLSALQFHRLTTQAPYEVWLAIDRKAWRPTSADLPLRIFRFSGDALNKCIEEHRVEGVPVKIYTPAKTVADCFKYRNKIGLDVALEAIRDCWKQRRASMDELWQAAKICRVANVMRPYLESLT
jgi:predicted transcriptional regulator of viral defense system